MTRAQMAALLVGSVFLVVGIGSAGCVGGRSSGQEHPRLPIGDGTAPDHLPLGVIALPNNSSVATRAASTVANRPTVVIGDRPGGSSSRT